MFQTGMLKREGVSQDRMRILILGGSGMLGHQLFRYLKKRHDVRATLRQKISAFKEFNIFDSTNAYPGVDVRSTDKLKEIFSDFHPEIVVNAVGIIKQLPSAKESIPSIEINALFPHQLALLCQANNTKMIHLSTDCVFSGKKGDYREVDPTDAEDLYGRTKLLGEVEEEPCITLRTSMIGIELFRKKSLLEWFLSQKGTVKGFKNAIFSGFTTQELSRIIEMIVTQYPTASGIYHVSSEPISKYELLSMIKEGLELPNNIIADETFVCNRSLNSNRFRRAFKYSPPAWGQMVDELCKEIRSTRAVIKG